MDATTNNQLLPGDPRLVDVIVTELKSQGIFDEFRKECNADVDTKPAFQNLRQRVENSVGSFLRSRKWTPETNKIQLREQLRSYIQDMSFLDKGVERIVDQVVVPKIHPKLEPKIAELVLKFLGIDQKPSVDGEKVESELKEIDDMEKKTEDSKQTETIMEVKHNLHENFDDKMDEDDESPPFEPLEGLKLEFENDEVQSQQENVPETGENQSNAQNGLNGNENDPNDSDASVDSSEKGLEIDFHDESSQSRDGKQEETLKKSKSDDKSSTKTEKNDKEKINDGHRRKSSDDRSRKSSESKDKSHHTHKRSRHSHDRHKKNDSRRSDKRDDGKNDRSTSRHKSEKNDKNDRNDKKDRDSNHRKDRDQKSDKHKRDRSKNRDKSEQNEKRDKNDLSKTKDKKKKTHGDDHGSERNKNERNKSPDRDSNDGSQSNSRMRSNIRDDTKTSKSKYKEKTKTEKSKSGGKSHSDSVHNDSLQNENLPTSSESPETFTQVSYKLFKPKFASNLSEAMKIMKIRKQLEKIEREREAEINKALEEKHRQRNNENIEEINKPQDVISIDDSKGESEKTARTVEKTEIKCVEDELLEKVIQSPTNLTDLISTKDLLKRKILKDDFVIISENKNGHEVDFIVRNPKIVVESCLSNTEKSQEMEDSLSVPLDSSNLAEQLIKESYTHRPLSHRKQTSSRKVNRKRNVPIMHVTGSEMIAEMGKLKEQMDNQKIDFNMDVTIGEIQQLSKSFVACEQGMNKQLNENIDLKSEKVNETILDSNMPVEDDMEVPSFKLVKSKAKSDQSDNQPEKLDLEITNEPKAERNQNTCTPIVSNDLTDSEQIPEVENVRKVQNIQSDRKPVKVMEPRRKSNRARKLTAKMMEYELENQNYSELEKDFEETPYLIVKSPKHENNDLEIVGESSKEYEKISKLSDLHSMVTVESLKINGKINSQNVDESSKINKPDESKLNAKSSTFNASTSTFSTKPLKIDEPVVLKTVKQIKKRTIKIKRFDYSQIIRRFKPIPRSRLRHISRRKIWKRKRPTFENKSLIRVDGNSHNKTGKIIGKTNERKRNGGKTHKVNNEKMDGVVKRNLDNFNTNNASEGFKGFLPASTLESENFLKFKTLYDEYGVELFEMDSKTYQRRLRMARFELATNETSKRPRKPNRRYSGNFYTPPKMDKKYFSQVRVQRYLIMLEQLVNIINDNSVDDSDEIGGKSEDSQNECWKIETIEGEKFLINPKKLKICESIKTDKVDRLNEDTEVENSSSTKEVIAEMSAPSRNDVSIRRKSKKRKMSKVSLNNLNKKAKVEDKNSSKISDNEPKAVKIIGEKFKPNKISRRFSVTGVSSHQSIFLSNSIQSRRLSTMIKTQVNDECEKQGSAKFAEMKKNMRKIKMAIDEMFKRTQNIEIDAPKQSQSTLSSLTLRRTRHNGNMRTDSQESDEKIVENDTNDNNLKSSVNKAKVIKKPIKRLAVRMSKKTIGNLNNSLIEPLDQNEQIELKEDSVTPKNKCGIRGAKGKFTKTEKINKSRVENSELINDHDQDEQSLTKTPKNTNQTNCEGSVKRQTRSQKLASMAVSDESTTLTTELPGNCANDDNVVSLPTPEKSVKSDDASIVIERNAGKIKKIIALKTQPETRVRKKSMRKATKALKDSEYETESFVYPLSPESDESPVFVQTNAMIASKIGKKSVKANVNRK